MKQNLRYTALFVSGLMLLLAACKKNDNNGEKKPGTPPVDVFVTGNSSDTAIYWADGKPNFLTDGSRTAYAHSIFVSGNNDVYITGEEFVVDDVTDQFMAAYWKDQQISFLTTGQQTPISSGASIYVSGNDVYVGGYEYKNGAQYATCWKNGTANVVDQKFSLATSVFVLGSDVYLGGGYPSDTTHLSNINAAYWKNGSLVSLTKGDTAGNISSIAVAGTHVYAAGYTTFTDGRHAAYWKDTTVVKLANSPVGSSASSICVSGGDVFVAGYQTVNGINVATYWKNNVPVTLSTKNSNANSIFLFGSDIYVAGYENDSNGLGIATYWKNGVATHIGYKGSNASSIFVKARQAL
jgi:hypothetical protein